MLFPGRLKMKKLMTRFVQIENKVDMVYPLSTEIPLVQ